MGNVSACNGIYDIHLRYSQYVDNFVVISVVFLFFVSHTNEIHNFGALLGQRYLSVVAPCVLSRWGDGNGERQRQRNGNGNGMATATSTALATSNAADERCLQTVLAQTKQTAPHC